MRLFLLSFFIGTCSFASAQYADLGTSSLKNKIWWFDWNGFAITNGASRTFTTDDGLTVTITFSNVSGATLLPDVMDTWSGALLYNLYNFSNTNIDPALYLIQNADWTSNFTLNITATRNGVATPFSFVAADAEASEAGQEFSILNTNGSAWSTIDFFRNSQQTSNPLTGCGTQSVTISDTYADVVGLGQNPVLETDAPATGLMNISVTLNEEAPGGGGMGLAFGIFAPVDRGDLPPSYGFAYHKLIYQPVNSCNYNPPYPTLAQSQALKIGHIAGDADPIQYTDDNAHELADEEGVSSFPVYNGSGTYSVNVVANNTTGNDAYLTGWFDYNRNGSFDPNESVTVTVPGNSVNATFPLQWTGLPTVIPTGAVTNYGFRFRLSSDEAATQSATGFALDGEVEDYTDTIIPPPVTPSFTIPDTVCVNSPVTITNTSTGASSYYWSFCTADINQPPVGTNYPLNQSNRPVYIDYVNTNGNYYGFVTSNYPAGLLRLDFGNSLLNTPAITNLGTVNGLLSSGTEGVQVVYNQGNWYLVIVQGDATTGLISPSLVTVTLGTNIANNNPTGTNWGNVGNLGYPHDLYVFQDNGQWFGVTANSANSTVTRFDFGTSFTTAPTGVNLGNVGNLNGPTGLHALQDDAGNWHVFVTNSTTSTLSRLDFGNSLLNTPTGVNLGNIGGTFNVCWDIKVIKYCGNSLGYVINAENGISGGEIVKLDFNGNLTNTPTAVDFGDIGNLNFPHCLSKLFRVGANVYSFIMDVATNSYTQLQFAGCNSSSTPNSALQNPPPVTYSTPGIYNINLTVDDSLPTQNSVCQQVVVVGPPNADFNFTQNVCNPLSIQFSNETQNAASLYWNFGNGTNALNDSAPLVTYASYNTYPVELIAKTSAGCADTITKNISLNLVTDSIITVNDTSVCSNSSFQLSAMPALSYCWSPSAGLSATNIANPLATVTQTSTYYLNEQATGSNLIINGDFSQGNQGFTSGYTYVAINTVEGQYFVGPNPQAWNGAMSPCQDHTGNNGNMLMLNGSPIPGTIAWAETLAVTPNTNYIFSAWIQTISPGYPAQLQFYINGNTANGVFMSDTATCTWKQFFITWNSGNSTSANISLIDNNTSRLGNDFALDDISFAESVVKHDSITIKMIAPPVVTMSPDTSICAGSNAQITASSSGNPVYKWLPSAGLNDSVISNPLAYPSVSTTYYVQVTGNGGCTAKDSVVITVLPQPTVKTIADTTICSGTSIPVTTTAINGNTYNWSPVSGLSNPAVLSPLATPMATTQYIITVNQGSQCFAKDTVNITVNPTPTVKASGDTALCSGGSGQLTAAATGNVSYTWYPTAGLSNAGVFNPVASPSSTTQYFITVAAGQCTAKDSLTVTVTPYPVITTIADTTIIICRYSSIQLVTTAVNGNTYSWSPAAGLSDSSVLSPVASPLINTKYVLTVNPGKCSAEDSVSISLKPTPSVTAYGDTAICSGGTVNLSSTASPGVTYNWSPSAGLSDTISANTAASPLSSTVYYVQVEYSDNCTARDSVTINVTPQPTVKSIQDTAICSGTTIQLVTTAANGNTYNWSPAAGLSNPTAISPQATPSATTQYIITVNPGTLCTAMDTVTITVNPTPTVKASGDTAICSGASGQLVASATGNVLYNWYPQTGLNDPSIYNPVASPAATTQYFITVVSGQCTAQDSINLSVLPQPAVKSIGDTAICSGTTIQLTATAVNGSIYNWSPATGLSNPAVISPVASPTATTQYILTVNPGALCTARDTVTITVNPLPVLTASNDTIICSGGAAQLVAFSPDNVSYNWAPSNGLSSTSVPNPLASPSATTTYYITITDNNQCASIDSVLITVTAQPVFSITPSSAGICIGENVAVTASGGDIYQWYPAAGVADPAAASTTVSPSATTTYQVYITNSTCKITDTVQTVVTVTTKPDITVSKSNDIDCIVGQATLTATGGYQYTWSPATGLDNPYSPNPVASPLQTITYYVTVSKGAGCTATDSIQLKVLTDVQNGYYLASVFTPNGDGHNDCFGVKLWGGIKSIDFSVYNRWGQRIFHTNNPSDCWDGTYNGQPQPPGTFVYQIQANTICGPVYRKGTVVLVR